MRIGILTYHCPPNFGAQLQAISTVGYLKKQGHEPIVLHYYPKDLEDMYDERIPHVQVECHESFTESVLPLSRLCRTEDELVIEINSLNLQLIILGSDALFKYVPQSKRSHFSLRKFRMIKSNVVSCEDLEGNPFFGGFIGKLEKKVPVSVFSVSSQNCPFADMNEEESQVMGNWMKQFSYITVRDEWTSNMVKHLTGLENVPITPDPVFSFNQNCYLEIPTKQYILNKYGLKENYVLLSFSRKFIHNDYLNLLAIELERKGFQPVALPMPEGLNSADIPARIELPLSPVEWYALIIHSRGYIGERMHPIVVCIHNVIPFFCFDEYGTLDRKLFGLKKTHYIHSSKTYLIVKKAGLDENLYSYWSKSDFPAIEDVVMRITNFDTAKCLAFSTNYQKQYCEMFNHLMENSLLCK